jgi:hypothetical protein
MTARMTIRLQNYLVYPVSIKLRIRQISKRVSEKIYKLTAVTHLAKELEWREPKKCSMLLYMSWFWSYNKLRYR